MKYVLAALFVLFLPIAIQAQTCVQADLNHPLSVAVTWQDNSTNEKGFSLERKLNTGAYAVIASGIGANVTAYTDSTVVRGSSPNTYTYRIKALASAGATDSSYSSEACITFAPSAPLPVNAPGGLTVAAISSSSFRITWEDLLGEVGYELEAKEARGNQVYIQIASLPEDRVTFDWPGRKRYTPYCVRLRGLMSLNSPTPATTYSPTVCATTSK